MKTKTPSRQTALKRRIRHFYKLLNERDFQRCYEFIDPRVRRQTRSVTLDQYGHSLGEFLDRIGSVKVVDLSVALHEDEPSALYEGRDFAVGKTTWEDAAGEQHVFAERWVSEGKSWYTRSTGFIAPEAASAPRRKRA